MSGGGFTQDVKAVPGATGDRAGQPVGGVFSSLGNQTMGNTYNPSSQVQRTANPYYYMGAYQQAARPFQQAGRNPAQSIGLPANLNQANIEQRQGGGFLPQGGTSQIPVGNLRGMMGGK